MRHRESSLDRAARAALVVAVCLALLTVSHAQDRSMNSLAEQYVRLVLAVGQHDADYVDAYYGPPEWRQQAEAQKRPLAEIRGDAEGLLAALSSQPEPKGTDAGLLRLRHDYLDRQIRSMVARIDLLAGKKMTFDEES